MLVRQGIEVITDRHRPRPRLRPSAPRRAAPRCTAGRGRGSPCPAHGEASTWPSTPPSPGRRACPRSCSARNGTIVRLAPGRAEIVDDVPVGRLYKDGDIAHRRRRARRAGAAQARLRRHRLGRDRDRRARRDRRRPGRSTSWACPTRTGSGEPIADLIADTVGQVLDSLSEGAAAATPRRSRTRSTGRCASAVNKVWGKKPACHVLVVEV